MTILIHVILNGKEYGMRRWSAVPRIGDKMVVESKDGEFVVKVTDIHWGVTKISRDSEEAEVNIICTGKLK